MYIRYPQEVQECKQAHKGNLVTLRYTLVTATSMTAHNHIIMHKHAHARMHAHTHAHTHMRTHTYAHAHTNTNTHTHTHSHLPETSSGLKTL